MSDSSLVQNASEKDVRSLHRGPRLAGVVGLVVVAATPILSRWLGVDIPRWFGFRLLMLWLVLCTFIWWTLGDELLSRSHRTARARLVLRSLLAAFALLVTVPTAQMLWSGRMVNLLKVPVWAGAGFQIWQMGLGLGVPIVIALTLIVRSIAGLVRRLRAGAIAAPTVVGDGISRREWMTKAGVVAPLVLFGGMTAAGARGMGRFRINKYDLPAPWLPSRLRGMTLTHVSDLHVGRLYRPLYLPRLVDAVNHLNSDIVLFTGDLVDVSNDMLPPSIAAMRELESRHGVFLSIGNHDMIDNRREFVETVQGAGLTLLLNQRRSIDIGGERLCIAGLDFTRTPEFHVGYSKRLMDGYKLDAEGSCIALAHHPHAFDALADAGVPLTLSGHTHGGQLMLRPPRADGEGDTSRDVGAGEFLYKYLRGFYRRGPNSLFVNSGVGNWFPIRINAPAEIVQIRLV